LHCALADTSIGPPGLTIAGKESPTASPGRSQVEPDQRIARLPGLIREVKLVTVEGGPHNIGWPPDGVNTALSGFLISQPGGTLSAVGGQS
jgi:hypothetical protein